ncbi:hypothetical protein [Clostridium sp.]|uniref:hypothetical protein n=1 Tax=Clostridium sp. TaxID=1506 RepID=UPI002FCBB0E2
MKKNATLLFTRILYVLFAIGTIITLFIVYKDIDKRIAFRFIIGYMFFTFFMLLYVPFITFFNLRKFKWSDIRKRLFTFIALFILYGASNYGLNYFFRPSNLDLLKSFSSALGLAFGITFIDVTFLEK